MLKKALTVAVVAASLLSFAASASAQEDPRSYRPLPPAADAPIQAREDWCGDFMDAYPSPQYSDNTPIEAGFDMTVAQVARNRDMSDCRDNPQAFHTLAVRAFELETASGQVSFLIDPAKLKLTILG